MEAIRRAARDGKVPMARVDDAVRRVLALKSAAGLFTGRLPNLDQARNEVGSPKNRAVELQSARAAIVAPRNLDHRIPLAAPEARKLVVISPVALDAYDMLTRMRGIGPNISEPPTGIVLRAIQKRFPGVELLRIVRGVDVPSSLDRLRAASAVLVATENYPLPGFDFPTAPQREVIHALIAAGIQPIVVGLRDPYELLDLPKVRTYLSALGYAPVCAEAAAEALFGERQPLGKIPVTV